jgi:hypothetical protein
MDIAGCLHICMAIIFMQESGCCSMKEIDFHKAPRLTFWNEWDPNSLRTYQLHGRTHMLATAFLYLRTVHRSKNKDQILNWGNFVI